MAMPRIHGGDVEQPRLDRRGRPLAKDLRSASGPYDTSRSLPLLERFGSVHDDRSKQHGRRLPLSIFEMLTSTRRAVSQGCSSPAPNAPLPPGHRRDVLPHRTDLRGCLGQGGREVVRHVWLGPVPRHLQGELGGVTRTDVGGPLEGVVDADPVATAAVRLDDGLEVVYSERGAHGHLPARGEPLAGLLRQAHEGRVVDRGQVGREAIGAGSVDRPGMTTSV